MTDLEKQDEAIRQKPENVLDALACGPVVRLADRPDGWHRFVLTNAEEDVDERLAELVGEVFGDAAVVEARDGTSQGFSRVLVAIRNDISRDAVALERRLIFSVSDELWRRQV